MIKMAKTKLITKYGFKCWNAIGGPYEDYSFKTKKERDAYIRRARRAGSKGLEPKQRKFRVKT